MIPLNYRALTAFLRRLLLEKSRERHVSLERPTGIGVPWVPAAVNRRCGSRRGRDPDCTPDAPAPHTACAVSRSWWCSLREGMCYWTTVSTRLSPLFLRHRYCRARPASADESPLVDSPLRPTLICLDGCGMWYAIYLTLHTLLRWTVVLTLVMQLSDAFSYTSNLIMGLHDTVHSTGTLRRVCIQLSSYKLWAVFKRYPFYSTCW
jgi:hypothetical protein